MPNDSPATKADLEALKVDIVKEIREYLDERIHHTETRLLRAFADYQMAQNTRFRHMKADLGNLNTATDERLAGLEERVTNIEKRLIEKHI